MVADEAYILFEDGKPVERTWYGQGVDLLAGHGYDRDYANPGTHPHFNFSGPFDRKAVMYWVGERNTWVIEPCAAEAGK